MSDDQPKRRSVSQWLAKKREGNSFFEDPPADDQDSAPPSGAPQDVPRPPLSDAPTTDKKAGSNQLVFVLLTLTFVIGGIILITIGFYGGYKHNQILESGEPALGYVIDTRSSPTGSQHWITYGFQAADGNTYENTLSVDEFSLRQQPLMLLYLPDNPKHSRIFGDDTALHEVRQNIYYGIGMFVVAGLLVGATYLSQRKKSTFQGRAQRITGLIVNITGQEQAKDQYAVTIAYTFISPATNKERKTFEWKVSNKLRGHLPYAGSHISLDYASDSEVHIDWAELEAAIPMEGAATAEETSPVSNYPLGLPFFLKDENREFSLIKYLKPKRRLEISAACILPIMFACVGVLIFGYFGIATKEASLEDKGVLVQALIIDKGRDTDNDYYTTYRFQGNNLRFYTDKDYVPVDLYLDYQVGDLITIRYLPDDPKFSRIEDVENNVPFRTLNIIVIIVASLATLFAIWDARRRWLRYRLIQTSGRVIEGRITHIHGQELQFQKGWRTHWRYGIVVSYSFTSPTSGEEIEGVGAAPHEELRGRDLPPEGTPVHVLYVTDRIYEML